MSRGYDIADKTYACSSLGARCVCEVCQMENILGVSWTNCSLIYYKILIGYEWKLVRELRVRIPSHFFMKPLLKVNGNTPGAPWTDSLTRCFN